MPCQPDRHRFYLRSAPAALLLGLVALLVSGCAQFHLSDGSGGIYEQGLQVFSSPLALFRKPKPEVPLPDSLALQSGTALFVDKSARKLYVFVDRKLKREYEVSLGRQAEGHKRFEGDRRTPEGSYRVTMKKDRGETRFYRALLLNYPTTSDWKLYRQARAEGIVPAGRGIGNLIEVHGGGTGVDWTDGCIALENDDMDDLFKRVRVGTPIVIVGDGSEAAPSIPETLLRP
ncbi:MAG: L,D-transpeptidase [Deltaproteobacteria bacterium]|nr:L,D-transpeptidase [Deltaproteobacteria bacterium]